MSVIERGDHIRFGRQVTETNENEAKVRLAIFLQLKVCTFSFFASGKVFFFACCTWLNLTRLHHEV